MNKAKLLAQKSGMDFSIEIIRGIYLAGFFILIMVSFYYQIIKGNYYFQRAKNNYVRVLPSRSVRGSIFDRNGSLLAYDKAAFNLSVIPYQIRNNKVILFKRLSDYLDCDASVISKNYNKNLGGVFSPVDIVINIDKADALYLKEEFNDVILITPQPVRYYPYPYQFAHVLGYVKEAAAIYDKLKKYGYTPLERVGFSGVEQYYDAYLKGEDGGDLIEVNAKGRVVGFLGERMPKKGKDIYLTIDSRIQNAAREAIKDQRGVIILMNSNSGEIVSLYSSPSFNPNYFVQGKNVNKFLKDKESPLLNRAIQSTYPLGSIFKPLLAVAALEEGKITPHTTFICNGVLKLGDTRFRCWSTHNNEDLYDALAHSCNIYFYELGLSLGPNVIAKWAKKFGLDSYKDIDVPYERKGFVPTPGWKRKKLKESWFGGDTVNFSIGQGYMQTTPLAAIVAMNVFANNGYLTVPYILKQVDSVPSELITKTYLGIKRENIENIKKGLRKTVKDSDGTAHILSSLGLQIAGKTGTAQTRGKSHGWFIGFFPYKRPKYTICVFIENGGSSHEAVEVMRLFIEDLKAQKLI